MSDQRVREIAARVKEARQAMNLSQDELGRRMGLSKVGYGDYERGRRLFDTEQLFLLSRIFNRSVEWFLGLETQLTEDEDEVLHLYRKARAAGRAAMTLTFLRTLAGE